MKKSLLALALFTLLAGSVFAQTRDNVARECVLFELFTGVRCQYCPAAANGVAQLLEEGKAIAPVAYHTSAFSVPAYYTTETNARASYYGVTSYPTLKGDGVITRSGGGSASESNYSTYLTVYNQRINQTSPFTITMTCTPDEEGHCVAHCEVEKVGNCSATNLRLMVALTQCNIDVSWQGMQGLHHVCRDMIPTQTGTPITGNSLIVDLPFELNWPKEDCWLTAWVQDYSTKEVFQAVRLSLDMNLDYDLAIKGAEQYAEKNCSGLLAPVVKVKNAGTEVVTSFEVVASAGGVELSRQTWTGSLQKGETATFAMAEFFKGDAAEITLQAANPNGHADEFLGDNNLSVSFEEVDSFDGYMSMMVKTDQHPEETSIEIWNMSTETLVYEFHFDLPRHVYTEEVPLMDAGCYLIRIKDSVGDGLGAGAFVYFQDAQNQDVFYLAATQHFGYEYPFEVHSDGTYAVAETESKGMTLYPNPSHGVMQLHLGEGPWQVEVFDLTGRTVYENADFVSGEIQLTGCGEGIYFLKASNGSESYLQKVMVY